MEAIITKELWGMPVIMVGKSEGRLYVNQTAFEEVYICEFTPSNLQHVKYKETFTFVTIDNLSFSNVNTKGFKGIKELAEDIRNLKSTNSNII